MLTVVGSLSYDLTIRVPRFPGPGETLHGHDFLTASGGKGANQAFAAARMAGPSGSVAMLGCVGDDAFSEAMLGSLRSAGVDVSLVKVRAGQRSGVALILVDANGQNEIVIAPGANATLTSDDVRAHASQIRASAAVVTQLEVPLGATETALSLARANGGRAVLNPAPFLPDCRALLPVCDYVIPNESEASELVGFAVGDLDSARRAGHALREAGARNALVTLGASGVWIDSDEFVGHVPSFRVRAVDTVGAGDTFIGAFVARLSEGARIQEAARFGCAAAAISVTRAGAQPSVPSRAEVEAMERG